MATQNLVVMALETFFIHDLLPQEVSFVARLDSVRSAAMLGVRVCEKNEVGEASDACVVGGSMILSLPGAVLERVGGWSEFCGYG